MYNITQNNPHSALIKGTFEMFPEGHSTDTRFHFKQHGRSLDGILNNQKFWQKNFGEFTKVFFRTAIRSTECYKNKPYLTTI